MSDADAKSADIATPQVAGEEPLAAKPRVLPAAQLQQLHNMTGLPHFKFKKMGPGRQFYDVVIVSASFDLQDGLAQLSDNQAGPSLVDEYWDEEAPENSSLRVAGDTVLYKPCTDVLVTGTVRSYQNKPQTHWHGLLRVRRGEQHLINKTLRFSGPRQWEHISKNQWRLNKPEPTCEVPLRYELAWGGHYIDPQLLKKQKGPQADKDLQAATQTFDPNPAGSGYFGPPDSPSHDPQRRYSAPQVEWEGNQFQKSTDIDFKTYQPAGWGPVARWWSPRVQRQGSYDDAWMQDFQSHDYADYPKDFQYTFFNCAPADQMIEGALRGDEYIELAGVFADRQTLKMQLPGWQLSAHSWNQEGKQLEGKLRLDTVHVDLDSQQVQLTWRLTLDHAQQIHTTTIDLIEVQA
jgi:hypothetical protein